VAQCERTGDLETFVSEYLLDRRSSRDFSLGALEEEARTMARKICAGDRTAKPA
jgi:predicted NBD/HSP70 family sugar kinase